MTDSGVSHLLTVSLSHSGAAVVVRAVGEIDITSAPRLRTVLEEIPAGAPGPVVDLSRVEFMGSVGLSLLLAAAEKADPDRVRVVASRQVRRPIEVTGLDQVLALFDSLEAALADFQRR
ncbi:STAS domain-containing protein [Nocardia sp. NPDC088792]|uniref:STAS domain-containing protein n=1 Tax=Nocardia sp. NPDC088792 TaxID=3364332 RepID=UPI0038010283